MPKMKYDWDKMKMEFILSDFNDVKGFIGDIGVKYNSKIATITKGWTKEKQAFKKKMYEDALKDKGKEISKDISDKAKRYEMLDEEFIAWMENQFQALKSSGKKGENRKRLTSKDVMNMRKIARTERGLPVNITKVEQTNKEERESLNDNEAEALKQLLKKSSK